MKLAFRVTIICVYLLSLIMSTFEDSVFLTAFSYLERPAPGNWNFPNPRPSTRPPHLGTQMQTTITPGVGPTLTIVKAQSAPQHPPRLIPPLLRGSRVYPYNHLTRPVNRCTHSPLWRLWRHEVRPDRLRRRFGTFMTRPEQMVAIIPALLRTARYSRASVWRYKLHRAIIESFRSVVHPVFRWTLYGLCPPRGAAKPLPCIM